MTDLVNMGYHEYQALLARQGQAPTLHEIKPVEAEAEPVGTPCPSCFRLGLRWLPGFPGEHDAYECLACGEMAWHRPHHPFATGCVVVPFMQGNRFVECSRFKQPARTCDRCRLAFVPEGPGELCGACRERARL